jgi:hypothetical protein
MNPVNKIIAGCLVGGAGALLCAVAFYAAGNPGMAVFQACVALGAFTLAHVARRFR